MCLCPERIYRLSKGTFNAHYIIATLETYRLASARARYIDTLSKAMTSRLKSANAQDADND